MQAYDLHVHSQMNCPTTPEQFLARLEEAGLYGAGVFSPGPQKGGAKGKDRLDTVLRFCKDYPNRLFPVFFIGPHEDGAIEYAKEAIERGIAAFKIICGDHYVYDDETMALLHVIAKGGKSVCFHTGILWNGTPSGDFNRPCNWEHMLHIPGLKFSAGHCSWPWIDECIALYGKIQNAHNNRSDLCEMFLDLTPGTPVIYRRELLTKLFTVGYDVGPNILFGTDCGTYDYSVEWARKWQDIDNGIYAELGVDMKTRNAIYSDNILRFFGARKEERKLAKLSGDGL
jgi:predicted TIM-barrel fold metal-dependent hydrolase